MRRHLIILAGLLAAALCLAGCGRQGMTDQAVRSKAFESAEPELKEQWLTAVSGLKTNDYVAPQLLLFRLRANAGLTADQRAVVEQTLKAVSGRMFDAAGRGDAKALAAMKELNEARGRSGGRTRN